MLLRHLFQPHRLPDPGNLRVPDSAWLQHLLASQLPAFGFILHSHDKFVVTSFDRRRDIQRKRIVAADMLTDFLSVDVNLTAIVHSFEVQQRPISAIRFCRERTVVPECLIVIQKSIGPAEF